MQTRKRITIQSDSGTSTSTSISTSMSDLDTTQEGITNENENENENASEKESIFTDTFKQLQIENECLEKVAKKEKYKEKDSTSTKTNQQQTWMYCRLSTMPKANKDGDAIVKENTTMNNIKNKITSINTQKHEIHKYCIKNNIPLPTKSTSVIEIHSAYVGRVRVKFK